MWAQLHFQQMNWRLPRGSGEGGSGRRNRVLLVSGASKWLLCQSIKYEGETELDGLLCGRIMRLDFSLKHLVFKFAVARLTPARY